MAPGGIVAFKKGGKSKKEPPVSDAYPEEFERGTAAGIAANPPQGVTPDSSAEQPATEQAAAPGIAPTADKTPEQQLQEQQAQLLKYQTEQGSIMKKTPADIIKERTIAREAQGLHSPYGPEKEKIAERRKLAEADVQEQAKDNLIKFLTRWGTLPGPTLVAMNRAGMEMLEQSDMDRKTQRKLMDQLTASENEINRAEYLRRIGEEEKAQEVIQKAGVEYFKVGKEIVDNTVKLINARESTAQKAEQARLTRELAEAKAANSSDYKTKLELKVQKIKEDAAKNGLTVSDAAARAKANAEIEEFEVRKQAAGVIPTLPIRQGELGVHERTEAVKSAKEIEGMVNEAMDRDSTGRRKAREADRKAGLSASDPNSATAKLRKQKEDEIRGKIGGGSAAPATKPSSSSSGGRDYSSLWK